ncbi:T-lymphocyte surface antigen Ly-9-like isoform X3 [Mugil cephalus]|uniref:T-lymphocyte surface antigen Ly-9-like isoform X3 n=1 Tax=Mugil cephalus TaxID=48193 RepID=UPI001FB6DC3F|nr:T-lymphocyte surface antigen Ly-9-like isoform X3 [Mugil cephalus]
MAHKSFLLAVFVLYSSRIQGSSAVTDVFVKRGDDVLLEVMDDAPKEFDLFVWTFDTSNSKKLVRYSPGGKPRVSEGYTGRVEFSVENYSVKLKNLQDDDSGVYTARVVGDKEQTVAKYMVTVQGPVSPVDLNPDSVSISSDSCNLTVTCSTEDSHISSTFTCDTKTCSQEGGDQSKVTNSGASLHVHLLNDAIICNHSNQVSWTQKKTQLQHLCSLHGGSSAVTDGFVKRGDEVLLEVMDDATKEFDLFVWTFNTSKVLVIYSPGGKPRVSESYTGRVEFSVENYSVKLKNLQDDDSGVYTARVVGDKEQTVAKYMVTVQGPVSPVDLNPDSVSISSDSCNLTVTCSTEDSHISSTFTCDTKTCSQEGGDQSKITNSGASLRVHLINDAIICNHSNQVSWTQKKTQTQDLCPLHAGSSAVTDVFVKRGDEVLLEVMDDATKEFDLFVWTFNTSKVLVRYSPGGKPRVSESYTGRVEFSVENYSVKLKNLQDDDSGVYTARVVGDKEQTVAKYMVTVQGPVSPVDLNPDSVSISSDSCNLTVTCSTEDSHISSTFTCDTKTCSQEGGDQSKVTNSGASLRVHLLNDAIICNHSNQVSWTQKKTQIQDLCPLHAGLNPPKN